MGNYPKKETKRLLDFRPKALCYLVAEAQTVYYWKNKKQATQDIYPSLKIFIRSKKCFSVKTLEKYLGYDRDKPLKESNLSKSKAENVSNQAYYYISKMLHDGLIKKTNKFERQKGKKPLRLYEMIKFQEIKKSSKNPTL